jgi:hypothetical protein
MSNATIAGAGTSTTQASSDIGFGRAALYDSDIGFAIAVSDDKKAFTATFKDFSARLTVSSPDPMVTRDFSFTIPYKAEDPCEEIPLFVRGFVAAEKGVNSHVILCANGQTSFLDFAETEGKDFVHQTKVLAGTGSELRITIFLATDRDSSSRADATLIVNAVDTDTAKKRPA